jgi:hypothetical protein
VTALYADSGRHEMVLLDVLQAFKIDDTYPSRRLKNNYDSKSHPHVLPGIGPPWAPNPHSVYLKLIAGILQ